MGAELIEAWRRQQWSEACDARDAFFESLNDWPGSGSKLMTQYRRRLSLIKDSGLLGLEYQELTEQEDHDVEKCIELQLAVDAAYKAMYPNEST